MTKINQEQIDRFHSGRMDEAEISDFRQQLESDPSLKAESNLQGDIINGLKEFRKAELKARLDALNVGPTWVEFVQQSTLMKSMGGVIVASIIGTGIYFLGEKNETIDSSAPISVEAPQYESIEYVWNLGLDKDPVNQNNELDKPVLEINSNLVASEIPESKPTQASITLEESSLTDDSQVFKPSFEAPSVQGVEEESEFVSSELDELPENKSNDVSENPIDVETELSKSTIIKYKYYDGKLFLKGDFDKAPYEILEINSARGRRIYVFYLDNYYKVGVTDRLTALPLVGDTEVIKELELLRTNK
ncbi:hypothetical protein [Ekhidna sp.]|uniref:hypothetical protein n=1 Tax=Ekhidna sp. TaxID=2608089 RepID=UPI003296C22A